MLNFSGAWRFDSPEEAPQGVSNAFSDLIGRSPLQIARQSANAATFRERYKTSAKRTRANTENIGSFAGIYAR